MMQLGLTVNGAAGRFGVDPDETLLDALRDRLYLTGAKRGCDEGECGACTVLIDGTPVHSCIFPAMAAAGLRGEDGRGFGRGRRRAQPPPEGLRRPRGGAMRILYSWFPDDVDRPAISQRRPIEGRGRRSGSRQYLPVHGVQRHPSRGPIRGRGGRGVTAIGMGTPRSDAEAKVRGLATYGVGYSEAGMLHARLLRSPVPAGRITHFDVSAARVMPGVHMVATAADAPSHRNGLLLLDTPFFALDTVLYEGEPIGMVVADTARQADAALQAIDLGIEELKPVSNVQEALAPGARLLHPDLDTYETIPGAGPWPKGGNCGGVLVSDPGGVDEAFETADVIVEDTYVVPRQYQAYLEPKSATASYDGWRWTIHVSHQFPYMARRRVAQALGVQDSRIRVIGHHIGGGFGARLDLGLEQYAALGASLTGRTVKLVNDRVEDLVTCMSRENATIRVRSGVTRDGRIVARDFECLMDAGAYASDTPYLTSIPMFMVGSVYRVGPTRLVAKCVYTNTAPSRSFPWSRWHLPLLFPGAPYRPVGAGHRHGPQGVPVAEPVRVRGCHAQRAGARRCRHPPGGL